MSINEIKSTISFSNDQDLQLVYRGNQNIIITYKENEIRIDREILLNFMKLIEVM